MRIYVLIGEKLVRTNYLQLDTVPDLLKLATSQSSIFHLSYKVFKFKFLSVKVGKKRV